ncbi:MAG: BrnA antitoxin family protein [Fibrobacteres bacterium]|jgi:predicted DNA binding CopG/RHH family protein|nr:BrnA antitoxin family protein [Fibrobacterota bacterium]
MRTEYDFSAAKKNPYASKVRKPISIRLDTQAIDYFKTLGEEMGMPYQSLINMFLMECAADRKRPSFRKAS